MANLRKEQVLILWGGIICAVLGWPLFDLWRTSISNTSETIFRVVYSVVVISVLGGVLYLITTNRRGRLGPWLDSIEFIRADGLMISLIIAGLWLAIFIIGRVAGLIYSVTPVQMLVGIGLAGVAVTFAILGLKSTQSQHDSRSAQDQPEPLTTENTKTSKLWLLAIGVSGWVFIILYAIVAVSRLTYPYELEWMEGGSLTQITHMVRGYPVYVAPSINYIPNIYTPLYYYTAAWVAQLVSPNFIALRVVSFASSVASFLLIFHIVQRETGSALFGSIAAGLFASTFRASGFWFDIGRPDSLAVMLLLAGFVALNKGTLAAKLLGSFLLTLCFLTKQTMLPAILILAAHDLIVEWRKGLAVLLATFLLIAGACLILNRMSSGWFAYYVFAVPSQHTIIREMLYGFWIIDIWLPTAVFLVLSLSITPRLPRLQFDSVRAWLRQPEITYLALLGGTFAVAWASKLSNGGFNNGIMPAHASLSVCAGLALWRIWKREEGLSASRMRIKLAIVTIVMLAQYAALIYNPFGQMPTSKDKVAGDSIVRTIGDLDGDVFILRHSYLAMFAGKTMYDIIPLQDLVGAFGGSGTPEGKKVIDDISSAIRERRFSAIIIGSEDIAHNGSPLSDLLPFIRQYYVKGPPLVIDNDVFWPVTGARVRPDEIYYPK